MGGAVRQSTQLTRTRYRVRTTDYWPAVVDGRGAQSTNFACGRFHYRNTDLWCLFSYFCPRVTTARTSYSICHLDHEYSQELTESLITVSVKSNLTWTIIHGPDSRPGPVPDRNGCAAVSCPRSQISLQRSVLHQWVCYLLLGALIRLSWPETWSNSLSIFASVLLKEWSWTMTATFIASKTRVSAFLPSRVDLLDFRFWAFRRAFESLREEEPKFPSYLSFSACLVESRSRIAFSTGPPIWMIASVLTDPTLVTESVRSKVYFSTDFGGMVGGDRLNRACVLLWCRWLFAKRIAKIWRDWASGLYRGKKWKMFKYCHVCQTLPIKDLIRGSKLNVWKACRPIGSLYRDIQPSRSMNILTGMVMLLAIQTSHSVYSFDSFSDSLVQTYKRNVRRMGWIQWVKTYYLRILSDVLYSKLSRTSQQWNHRFQRWSKWLHLYSIVGGKYGLWPTMLPGIAFSRAFLVTYFPVGAANFLTDYSIEMRLTGCCCRKGCRIITGGEALTCISWTVIYCPLMHTS